MSADNLEQRVVELEDRVKELEQLLGDDVDTEPPEKIVPMPDEYPSLDSNDRDQRKGVHAREIISRIPGVRDDGVPREDVVEALAQEGFDNPGEEVDKLRRQGDIYNPKPRLIKVV